MPIEPGDVAQGERSLAMLHYVRGDGGMAVLPVSELIRWVKESRVENTTEAARLYNAKMTLLIAELEAIGK